MDQARLNTALRTDLNEIHNHLACLIEKNPKMMETNEDFAIVDRLTDAQRNANQTENVIKKNEALSPDLVTYEVLKNNEVDTEEASIFFSISDSF